MLDLFLLLVGFHLVGDVVIRTFGLHRLKRISDIALLFHCYLWATSVSIPLYMSGRYNSKTFIFLFVGHALIDKTKGLLDRTSWLDEDGNLIVSKWIVLDQLAHMAQLIVVAL